MLHFGQDLCLLMGGWPNPKPTKALVIHSVVVASTTNRVAPGSLRLAPSPPTHLHSVCEVGVVLLHLCRGRLRRVQAAQQLRNLVLCLGAQHALLQGGRGAARNLELRGALRQPRLNALGMLLWPGRTGKSTGQASERSWRRVLT